MKEINDDELQFVARHYQEEALDTDRAWKRLRQHVHASAEEGGGVRHISIGSRRLSTGFRRLSTSSRRIAASVSIALIVGASVACGFWYVRQQASTAEGAVVPESAATTPFRYLQPQAESIVLKYEDAPIDDVLSEISSYYGRTLVLQSPSASERCISGEIEATSLEEVIEILEATLDIEIVIQNKN